MEAIDYERFSPNDDMKENQFFESFETLVFDHLSWNPGDIFEVWRALDERIKVKIWGNRLERRRRALRRHIRVDLYQEVGSDVPCGVGWASLDWFTNHLTS